MNKMIEHIKTKKAAFPLISISDCTVDTILIGENTVSLCFDNYGFYVNETGDEEYRYVPNAQIILYECNADAIDLFIFECKTIRIIHWYKYIQKKINFGAFVKKINSKKWKMEIIEEYDSVLGGLFYGCIHGKGIGNNRFYLAYQCEKIGYKYANQEKR